MKYPKSIFTALLALGLCTSSFAAEQSFEIGTANFAECLTNSKMGKQEQASFESLKKQMGTLLEETEKQINDLSAKFNDSEYMDGLSPEAETELKTKMQALHEDMSRYQNQYYQVLNQANMRIMQTLGNTINQAAEKVAKDKHLKMVLNKDACFFTAPSLEVTNLIIAEMDKMYEQEGKKQQAAANAPAPQAAPKQTAKADEKTATEQGSAKK